MTEVGNPIYSAHAHVEVFMLNTAMQSWTEIDTLLSSQHGVYWTGAVHLPESCDRSTHWATLFVKHRTPCACVHMDAQTFDRERTDGMTTKSIQLIISTHLSLTHTCTHTHTHGQQDKHSHATWRAMQGKQSSSSEKINKKYDVKGRRG